MNLQQLKENFESLAADDPLWTVLSDNAKRGGKWDLDELYATGESLIIDLEKRLAEKRCQLGGDTALDFGCGVGRITFPLSKRFRTCYGIDISPSMIAFARSQIQRGPNCQFIENASTRLERFEDASIDFIYSAIVLQHIAPRYTREYLKAFARILRPDGLIAFQLPSHLDPDHPDNQRPFRLLQKRLHYRAKSLKQQLAHVLPFINGESFFEMNAIPRDRMIRFLTQECRLEILDVQDFPAAGPAWKSFLYLARKPC